MVDMRAIALSLPEAVEIETWGHPTFRIRKKMFASMATDGSTCTVKAVKEEQQACLRSEPDKFFMPAYVGKAGWIGINLDQIDRDELEELVTEAWRLTAPKKLLRTFDEAHPVPDG
jgi:hypothetical protein